MENIRSVRKNRELTCIFRQRTQDPCAEGRRIPLYPRRCQDPPDSVWRRPAEGHAFRYGKCAGVCRTWRGSTRGVQRFCARIEKLYTLREHLIAGLKPLGGVTINGSEDRTNAPQIVSASFEGVRSEVLLHALEDKGVYVSSGSACSSNHPGISGTLKGIGVKKELLDSTIRFSLGDLNTEEEVDYAIGVLGELLPVLRRYQMK